MKYITQVKDGSDIKHIVEVNGKNVEVIELGKVESYGDKQSEKVFEYQGIKIAKDLTFKTNSSDYLHLAKIILSIELVRFVINHLKGEN